MNNARLLEYLGEITDEERSILEGRQTIEREIYMQGLENVVNCRKLLSDGKLITLRPHTRFIEFPEHTHDYVETVYMCSGHTTHIINGKTVELNEGELLFLGLKSRHRVLKAEKADIAVNFIVLPAFFNETLTAISHESAALRLYLTECLCGGKTDTNYLHFKVSGDLAVQNLAENLIMCLVYDTPNRRSVSRMTMTLLFLHLLGCIDRLEWDSREESVLKILSYIEKHYADGDFKSACSFLRRDMSSLSREIKLQTGKTYTELVQEKRMSQAAFLLQSTERGIADIAVSVGYENISYFHRLFRKTYGVSPAHYRKGN